jgi:Flp pilus assembly protein TadB
MGEGKNEGAKIGIVQIAIFTLILGASTYFTQFSLVPTGAAQFVVPLFQPSGDLLAKMGFVNFDGDGNGLVYASTSKKNEALFANKQEIIAKKKINKEYIFDFTHIKRETKVHGYSKLSNEFYIKAPPLGEYAIILEPMIAFIIISFVIGLMFTVILTMVFPSAVGLMSAIFVNQIQHTKANVRLQTGFSADIVEILTMPNGNLKNFDRDKIESAFRYVWERTITDAEKEALSDSISFDDVWDDETDVIFFRTEAIYHRITEYFSAFVTTEVVNTRDARDWKKNKLMFMKGFRLFMVHYFTHQFANNVTGLAYGGAAILIIAIGIRGLKFIPAAKPSIIMGALFIEFSLLALMAITLFYTEEEERTDKMLKRMEDSNRSQLDALKAQQKDMSQLATALVGDSADMIKVKVEEAITGYLQSGDQVNSQIAEAIADKIVFDIAKK